MTVVVVVGGGGGGGGGWGGGGGGCVEVQVECWFDCEFPPSSSGSDSLTENWTLDSFN